MTGLHAADLLVNFPIVFLALSGAILRRLTLCTALEVSLGVRLVAGCASGCHLEATIVSVGDARICIGEGRLEGSSSGSEFLQSWEASLLK